MLCSAIVFLILNVDELEPKRVTVWVCGTFVYNMKWKNQINCSSDFVFFFYIFFLLLLLFSMLKSTFSVQAYLNRLRAMQFRFIFLYGNFFFPFVCFQYKNIKTKFKKKFFLSLSLTILFCIIICFLCYRLPLSVWVLLVFWLLLLLHTHFFSVLYTLAPKSLHILFNDFLQKISISF